LFSPRGTVRRSIAATTRSTPGEKRMTPWWSRSGEPLVIRYRSSSFERLEVLVLGQVREDAIRRCGEFAIDGDGLRAAAFLRESRRRGYDRSTRGEGVLWTRRI
jgi:hypothetical protein